jgi:hypothetical protein
MTGPRKAKGLRRILPGCQEVDGPGPWEVDKYAALVAAWLQDKPLSGSMIAVNGQLQEFCENAHPSINEIQEKMRFYALVARRAYLEQADVAVERLEKSEPGRDWDNVYRRPDIPLRIYQKRVKAARLALQSMLDCNFTHMPAAPEWRDAESDPNFAEREEFWIEYTKNLMSYHADVFEVFEKAHDMLSEIELGLANSKGQRGAKRDWRLHNAAVSIWIHTSNLGASAEPDYRLPYLLRRDICRAIWRDAGLPVGVNTQKGGDEDAWIDKQLKQFDKDKE